MEKCIFLDRDGTIIRDIGFAHLPSHLEFLPNAIEGMKAMRKKGYLLIIITNQSGIGRNIFSEEQYLLFMKHMYIELEKCGVIIEKDYFCPHLPSENCKCRKPNTYLVDKAKIDFCIDLKKSYFIGDKDIDIITGKRSGCKTIAIESEKHRRKELPDFSCKDLLDAAKIIS